MRRSLPFVIIAVAALLMLWRNDALPRKVASVLTMPKNHMASAMDGSKSIHVRGPSDATSHTRGIWRTSSVALCGTLAGAINQLEHDYHLRLRIIFITSRSPVTSTRAKQRLPRSRGPAKPLWEMHDLPYREQAVWSKAAEVRMLFNAYAEILPVEHRSFKKDMQSDEAKSRVTFDPSSKRLNLG